MNERLPFTTDVNDFDYASGLLSLQGQQLFLQMEVKDGFTEAPKTDLQEITIQLHQLEKVVLKSNFFRVKLILYTNDLKVAKQVPGYQNNVIKLKIPKKQAINAKKLAAELQLGISEIQLRNAQRNRTNS
ncbi:MAG TPA: hypothetical protein DCS93_22110 [Microscillaceae bacterium]|nr:hypothetical protein [Microscillaceae bacterium]